MPTISGDNYGPVVNVITWFLLVATIITVITRTAMRWALTRKVHLDDAVILAAAGLAIAQSVVITAGMVPNGLGQRHDLSGSQRVLFQKYYYVASLLYIPCICLSNLAVLCLLQTITPIASHKKLLVATEALTVTWATTAEVAMAFQCKLPTPWAVLDGQCFDLITFWYCFGVIQLLLDITLVILPWIFVRHVQMSRHRKRVIVSCFGTRLTVVAAVVAQLAFFNSAFRSEQAIFDLWSEIICTEVVETLSVMTACVPHLKRFFDSIESGMLRNDDLRRRGLASDDVYAASMSRQAASSAMGPARETINLNMHLNAMPGPSTDKGHEVIPIGMRWSQQAGPSSQPPGQQPAPLNRPPTDGPARDSDSFTR
ncbi:MAG: hypothetical protein Q9207_007098 [Kuettlingeria erythrocarpa]